MKILVLQLTRFGDILCTLPALSALRRERPEAEIHFMVRKKFAEAAEGCQAVDHLWRFDSQRYLKFFIEGSGKITDAATELQSIVREVRAEKFDLIINLSFSPSSSYLTHLFARGGTPVLGYTRTSDFYLHVPDQQSRYFRAQVGLDKNNRIHVSDVMSWIAGFALKEHDWHPTGAVLGGRVEHARSGIICHLGASQEQKAWSQDSWVSFLRRLVEYDPGVITLIGSAAERALAEKIYERVFDGMSGLARNKIVNRAGETKFNELKNLMATAELYVGADSGPMHVAGLAGLRVLNLSVGDVRFWETGPVTKGSRILVSRNPELLGSDRVFEMAKEMIEYVDSREGYIECVSMKGIRYQAYSGAELKNDFWQLVDWMYFDGPRPVCGGEVLRALTQIQEVCEMSVAQLETFFKNPLKVEVVGVLDRLDEVLEMFRSHIVPLTPLLDEFKTRKENIPPGSREEIFYQTKNCYTELHRRAASLAGMKLKLDERESVNE